MTFEAVEPRLAATVVLLRRGAGRAEVLLTRRPSSMAFAADMHVFPGGRLDPGDSDAALVERAATDPAAAADALGGDLEPSVAIGLHVAAIRELFEEAGVLLAEARDGASRRVPVSLARTALVGGDASFAQIAAGPRPAAADRPADAALALGDAADPAAPLRRPVLRRRAAGGRRASRSRATRSPGTPG